VPAAETVRRLDSNSSPARAPTSNNPRKPPPIDSTGDQCHNAPVRLFRLLIVLFSAGLALAGVQRAAAEESSILRLPDGRSVTLEIASTPTQRSLGLMFRPSLANDHGMLFLFPEPDRLGIWMKNMLIPLDILWLDDHKRIIHIETNVPPCSHEPCLIYQPDIPARYVIELASGTVTQAGLQQGLTLQVTTDSTGSTASSQPDGR
jgi:uncharacterized membrane protein (UPF0127 family)